MTSHGECEHVKSVCSFRKVHVCNNTGDLWKTGHSHAHVHTENASLWPRLWPATQAALSHSDCSSSARQQWLLLTASQSALSAALLPSGKNNLLPRSVHSLTRFPFSYLSFFSHIKVDKGKGTGMEVRLNTNEGCNKAGTRRTTCAFNSSAFLRRRC